MIESTSAKCEGSQTYLCQLCVKRVFVYLCGPCIRIFLYSIYAYGYEITYVVVCQLCVRVFIHTCVRHVWGSSTYLHHLHIRGFIYYLGGPCGSSYVCPAYVCQPVWRSLNSTSVSCMWDPHYLWQLFEGFYTVLLLAYVRICYIPVSAKHILVWAVCECS